MNKQQVEVTKEELIEFFEKIKIDNDKEKLVMKEILSKKIEYDFSKVSLKKLSKRHLIRIIYQLKERLDVYETN